MNPATHDGHDVLVHGREVEECLANDRVVDRRIGLPAGGQRRFRSRRFRSHGAGSVPGRARAGTSEPSGRALRRRGSRSPTGSKGGKLRPVERPDDRAADAAAAREAELLDAVAAGDRGAPLKELYHRYEGRLYGLGLRLLGDAGLAEEMVQETFLRLWRSADRYDRGRGAPSTFIFTIARRLALDLWRRPSSRRFIGSTDGEPAPDAVER